MHHNRDNYKGNTLLELLLYMVLATIIIGILVALYSLLVRSRVENDVIQEVQAQAQIATEIINREIANSTGINSPTVANSGNSLSLAHLTPASDPTIFSLNQGQIIMTQGANPALAITANNMIVSNLTFINSTRAGTPGLITYEFTIDYRDNQDLPEKSFQKTYRTSVSLR